MKEKQAEKGITLVALVVTIIILLILCAVTINMLFGDNGLIKNAQEATEAYKNAETLEGNLINDTSDYIDSFVNGENEKLPQKTLWFGDSLMRGYGNNNNGFPEYFAQITGLESINASFSGATITDNTTEASGSSNPLTLKDQIELVLSRPDVVIPSEIELIVLDGGGNDILAYEIAGVDESYKKEVGTVSDTTSDTVINDFREVINRLRQNFPNAKILFTKPIPMDSTFFEIIAFKVAFGNATLAELNQQYGQSCATIEEFRGLLMEFQPSIKADCEAATLRANQLFNEIQLVCSELGVEYLDLSYVVAGNRKTDGSDTNTYIQADTLHITDEGYRIITPLIIKKIETMF